LGQVFALEGHLFDFSQSETVTIDVPLTTAGGGMWLESNTVDPLLGPAGGP